MSHDWSCHILLKRISKIVRPLATVRSSVVQLQIHYGANSFTGSVGLKHRITPPTVAAAITP